MSESDDVPAAVRRGLRFAERVAHERVRATEHRDAAIAFAAQAGASNEEIAAVVELPVEDVRAVIDARTGGPAALRAVTESLLAVRGSKWRLATEQLMDTIVMAGAHGMTMDEIQAAAGVDPFDLRRLVPEPDAPNAGS